jgi:hypothetical protein
MTLTFLLHLLSLHVIGPRVACNVDIIVDTNVVAIGVNTTVDTLYKIGDNPDRPSPSTPRLSNLEPGMP